MDYKLYHHGISGQKWGVRRYQNEDGTLTEAGKKRYGKEYEKSPKKADKEWVDIRNDLVRYIIRRFSKVYANGYNKAVNYLNNDGLISDEKAKSLVKKYDMTSLDELFESNAEIIDGLRENVETYSKR
jgi:hypothetical protein